MLVWTGPRHASHTVVLAPGDEGKVSDSAPTALSEGLAKAGIGVARFGFSCHSDDPGERDALLARAIRAAVEDVCAERLVLAGLSRGARVSAMLTEELDARGLLALAYPFHARGDPDPGTRVAQLARVSVPVLLFQGTRDSHGNQPQVVGYGLPEHIRVHWLEDANHALRPRPSSGFTQAGQLERAAQIASAFILAL